LISLIKQNKYKRHPFTLIVLKMSSENTINKRHRTHRDAADFKALDDVTHVLNIPDTYIGSTDPEDRNEIILDTTNKKLINSKVSISKGVERLFLEILSNAGDNTYNSRYMGVNPGSIDVTMDRQWITVRNGGVTIPIEYSPENPDKLVPELIFGQLRSSSNYDPKIIRMGCGRNGFGAKLTNIFSTEFRVRIGDDKNKKLYFGTWKNNMTEKPESVIESYSGPGFVEVSWCLDFKRFGLEYYPDEAFFLFARYVADFSLTCKVPVSFNGEHMDLRSIRDYAALYWTPEECDKALVHHEWPGHNKDNENGICPFSTQSMPAREKLVIEAATPESIPQLEILILDTPDAGVCLSYVNGLLTIDGGVHVSEVFSALSSKVLQYIEHDRKNTNKKKKDAPDAKAPKLTADDIKRHVSIIINCRLPDPKYTSQSKTKMSNPRPHVSIPERIAKIISGWDLIARLYAALEAKMFNLLKKTNGSGRVKHLNMDAGEDANDAGTDKSLSCVLYLVEGKSASSYPKKRIVMSSGGKDVGGYYPLRGKFMNVRNAKVLQIAENKEVKAIKSMLGLMEGVDYTLDENLATLRYGYIMICVDADSDGFHIASLLINYINQFYPGILYKGRVGILRTPVVRVFDNKGNIIHRFYNNTDFERWEKTPEAKEKGYKVIYYKGLGKSDDEEIKDDLTTAPVVTVVYDDSASDSLTLAFDKSYADQRKEWISKWREVTRVEDIIFETKDSIQKYQKITDFINCELIDYTKDALFRAIPSQDDGLKRSHRQALYAALKYFRFGRKNELIGVSRFANYAANETNYHHGEMSMCDTVIKMTQSYIGSNNLSWFHGKGQFGTRSELGEDAASPRYLSINLPKYINLLYDEEMIECIPKRVVEGDEVEPMYVPAVIPMHLVNGVVGIATGYSTFIPNHNYYEIIDWCKKRCEEIKIGTISPTIGILKPWYRGFTGTIAFEDSSRPSTPVSVLETEIEENDEEVFETSEIKKDEEKNDEDIVNEEEFKKVMKSKGLSVKSTGIYKIATNKSKDKANLTIEEIPIGSSIFKYRKWLEELVKDKVIADFRDNSTTEKPNFSVTGYNLKDGNPSINTKNLHLEKKMSLNNITMIDEEGYPTKFTNTNEVMEVYSRRMFDMYNKVKVRRLEILKETIEDLTHRIRFISLVIEGKLIIFKRPEKDIFADMAKQSPPIPERYLDLVKSSEYTNERLAKKNEEITKLHDEFNKTSKISPEDIWLERLTKLETYLRKNGF
jgi:DNA topoisomerase-2